MTNDLKQTCAPRNKKIISPAGYFIFLTAKTANPPTGLLMSLQAAVSQIQVTSGGVGESTSGGGCTIHWTKPPHYTMWPNTKFLYKQQDLTKISLLGVIWCSLSGRIIQTHTRRGCVSVPLYAHLSKGPSVSFYVSLRLCWPPRMAPHTDERLQKIQVWGFSGSLKPFGLCGNIFSSVSPTLRHICFSFTSWV